MRVLVTDAESASLKPRLLDDELVEWPRFPGGALGLEHNRSARADTRGTPSGSVMRTFVITAGEDLLSAQETRAPRPVPVPNETLR
ncbi:hypothetical protein V5P93_004144 [Actinokineospora auranticolor]|uniref:Uncharacterized protein n=1 Tax=Actinokineospora auranticolor TaxID=155976 RepID=A0A2S6GIR8_9PSEU|nr:hypothetical protein [Actinokineospora auranticolor]PPK65115.1 hypothetical protein CLV40_116158 [Actinokineospora auranticolor]